MTVLAFSLCSASFCFKNLVSASSPTFSCYFGLHHMSTENTFSLLWTWISFKQNIQDEDAAVNDDGSTVETQNDRREKRREESGIINLMDEGNYQPHSNKWVPNSCGESGPETETDGRKAEKDGYKDPEERDDVSCEEEEEKLRNYVFCAAWTLRWNLFKKLKLNL